MLILELACLGIVAVYLAAARGRVTDHATYLRRFAILVVASWITEDSCIRLYGFYSYSEAWTPFVGRVPLLIVLIWPIVILSALELAQHLLANQTHAPATTRVACASGALVLADASFIEPISVQARLWTWHQPGFLGVPPIGIVGWGLFTVACTSLFLAADRRRARPLLDLAAILIAPLATHAALLALWWGSARWVSAPIPDWPAAAAAWGAGLVLTTVALHRRSRERIPVGAMTSRIPAALFFLVLLAIHGPARPALVVYALAFNPPYLALTNWRAMWRPAQRDTH